MRRPTSRTGSVSKLCSFPTFHRHCADSISESASNLESTAPVNEGVIDGIAQIGSLENMCRCKAAMIEVRMTPSILKSHGGFYSSAAKVLSGSNPMKQLCGGKCIR